MRYFHNVWTPEWYLVYRWYNCNDRLLSLKDCDVGAIYLGKADTQYHLNQKETNQTQAVIRQTGIFLRESGGTGTIQHVDLAV